jgi:hypothetical protein
MRSSKVAQRRRDVSEASEKASPAQEAGSTVGGSPRPRGAHLPEIASRGGRAVVQKYGSEHMARLGRLGARTVAERYGPGFYAEMGARNKGVKKRRRRSDDGSGGGTGDGA